METDVKNQSPFVQFQQRINRGTSYCAPATYRGETGVGLNSSVPYIRQSQLP